MLLKLLGGFVDQLHIQSLFQSSVAFVMIYVYTVYYLTSARKLICKGILKNNRLECVAPVIVKYCAECMMYTDSTEVIKPACSPFCIVSQIASDFYDISCEWCTPNVIAQIYFLYTLTVYNFYILWNSDEAYWIFVNGLLHIQLRKMLWNLGALTFQNPLGPIGL
jgi:hypothetical protein